MRRRLRTTYAYAKASLTLSGSSDLNLEVQLLFEGKIYPTELERLEIMRDAIQGGTDRRINHRQFSAHDNTQDCDF